MSDPESSSEEEEVSPVGSPVKSKPAKGRPPRQKAVPAKLLDTVNDKEEVTLDLSRSVEVVCCQTGKHHKNIKLTKISREDSEPLSAKDLFEGSRLLLDLNRKSYPVEFLHFTDKDSKSSRKRDRDNVIDLLMKAKNDGESSKRPKPGVDFGVDKDETEDATKLTNSDKDMIIELSRKMSHMEKAFLDLSKQLKKGAVPDIKTDIKTEAAGDGDLVNGINVMRIPTRDAYSFALQLLDMLFSKEELGVSLLFQSKKSNKPGLEKERVDKLLGFVNRRFGDWDMKMLTCKINQKCRDAAEKPATPKQKPKDVASKEN